MKKYLFRTAMFGSLLLTAPAQAEDSAKVLLENIDGPDQTKSSLSLLLLHSMGAGMVWSNALLANLEQPLMFCQPKKLSINGRQYLAILRTYVESNPSEAELPVGLVLLAGLRATYPCTLDN